MTVREYLKTAVALFNDTYDMIQSMYYNWKLIPLQCTKENNRVWARLHSAEEATEIESAFGRMGQLLDRAIAEADKKTEAMSLPERERITKELLPDLTAICKRWIALEEEEVIIN